jgi:hypothetical protein
MAKKHNHIATRKSHCRNNLDKIPEYIREKDEFGQVIGLNFAGADTFQTLPGGMVSLVCYWIVAGYFAMKFKEMYLSENWSLNTQVILNSDWEL